MTRHLSNVLPSLAGHQHFGLHGSECGWRKRGHQWWAGIIAWAHCCMQFCVRSIVLTHPLPGKWFSNNSFGCCSFSCRDWYWSWKTCTGRDATTCISTFIHGRCALTADNWWLNLRSFGRILKYWKLERTGMTSILGKSEWSHMNPPQMVVLLGKNKPNSEFWLVNFWTFAMNLWSFRTRHSLTLWLLVVQLLARKSTSCFLNSASDFSVHFTKVCWGLCSEKRRLIVDGLFSSGVSWSDLRRKGVAWWLSARDSQGLELLNLLVTMLWGIESLEVG